MMTRSWKRWGVCVCGSLGAIGFGNLAGADRIPETSIGAIGIDAVRLHQPPYNLLGRKIAIGQVEIDRPAQFGIDKLVPQSRFVPVTQVFLRNEFPKLNQNVDAHPFTVASIMIGQVKGLVGVAPQARLYAAATGIKKRYGQPEACLSAQHVAMQNGGDMRAINMSFGESLKNDPRNNAVLDGNALLTQCIDWSSRIHDVLYVVAGNQGKGGISIPTDNYNGINAGYTTRLDGIYRKVDFANLGDPSGSGSTIAGIESNVGLRRAIGLVAPGDDVVIVNFNGRASHKIASVSGRTIAATGTSYAAPHVTATVALLQEFGDQQIRRSRTCQVNCSHPWGLDARRALVMKAVLMNSADKLQDSGNGWMLGMSRTVLDKNNQTWADSDAYRSPTIPLHVQMGTGQLNAFRAYQQFSSGQWRSKATVPAIGWDYDTLESVTAIQEYRLKQPLSEGSMVSMTLAWNRVVDLEDSNGNQMFDAGERFRDHGLNNLDLYLLPESATDIRQSIALSISDVDSVEHIFAVVPKTGRYKIWVKARSTGRDRPEPYALAWWTKPAS